MQSRIGLAFRAIHVAKVEQLRILGVSNSPLPIYFQFMLDFPAILEKVEIGRDLASHEMQSAIGWFLTGEADHALVRRFLIALAAKGETVDELAGAATAMRSAMISIRSVRQPVFDTCGTGGDGSKTFNISTAAALVLAASGVAVAKHGNRKITSSTGSADVLAELGIDLAAPPEVAERCLNEIGICFCFAPFFHPAMKHVGEVRRSIEHPTIFNRLGPLANPAGANRQVLGVGQRSIQCAMAETLQRLGTERSLVVQGEDGVDELSISGPTRVLEVTPAYVKEWTWQPSDFGFPTASRDDLYADSPGESAACIANILHGAKGPQRNVVVMNAAAALWLDAPNRTLQQCVAKAEMAIDSGRAHELVQKLGKLTREGKSA